MAAILVKIGVAQDGEMTMEVENIKAIITKLTDLLQRIQITGEIKVWAFTEATALRNQLSKNTRISS